MTEQNTYVVDDEQKRRESAAQSKLAAMFATSKDEICIPKIYVDMVGDIPAAAVLDEVMFWTLPKPRTGKTSLRVKKNGVLWLAVRRTDWWERKRLTARQSDTAIEKLVENGLIEKDVWNYNGKPTVHIRMKMSKFVELYAQKMTELMENDAENDEENTIKDIQDLYEMMGMSSNSRICNLQNGEGALRSGEGTSPNGEFINSPYQPLTATNASQTSKPTARIDRTETEQEELDKKKNAWLFPANQAEIDANIFAKEAVNNFESCLHFNPLPWSQNREWERFEKFVVDEYRKDATVWQRYDEWRKDKGKYAGALSNKAIKYRPDDFIACFPDFLAHTSMYGKSTRAKIETDSTGAPITY